MNMANRLGASSPPYVAASIYTCLLLVLMAATALPLKGMLDQQRAVDSLGDTLLRLERHGPAVARSPAGADGPGAGSSFLEGATVTVANDAKGVHRTIETNNAGIFAAPALAPRPRTGEDRSIHLPNARPSPSPTALIRSAGNGSI